MNLLVVLALGLISASCSDESPEPQPPGNAVMPSTAYDEWLHEEARCGACHTETTEPSSPFNAQAIETLTYERRAGYGYGSPGATRIITLRRSGVAELDVQITGPAPPVGIGSFAAKAPRSASARVTPEQWSAITEQVAATGLFQFDGVAVTSFATHAEVAHVTVNQPGRPDCTVGSMHVLDDSQHPTLLELLGSLSNLDRELAWSDDPR